MRMKCAAAVVCLGAALAGAPPAFDQTLTLGGLTGAFLYSRPCNGTARQGATRL